MDIANLRENINQIDDEILKLFIKRMDTALQIAQYKKENILPVLDKSRERAILNHISEMAGSEMEVYSRVLFSTLFNLSKSYQSQQFVSHSALVSEIDNAKLGIDVLFPSRATVACQGVEGSYGQQACEKLFKLPDILYFSQFEGIFNAVEKGMCRYGILPIENSSAGSVTAVYDLMKKHKFHIARSIKLKVNHALLAKNGTSLESIKEIVSHEQAINQCRNFLSAHPEIKVTALANTAAAAKYVADCGRDDIAAISSGKCAGLYGLSALLDKVQDSDSNYTRFICISKDMEIYPGANKISLMLSIPHEPGSLYNILSKISALDLNLTKIESRPILGKDFEFMFYFDIDASVYSEKELSLLCELENCVDNFVFLGNYSEVF